MGAGDPFDAFAPPAASDRDVHGRARRRAGLLLTGCSAGQVTQTATQVSAVNGNSAEIGLISLRNVHVVFPNNEEYTNSAGATRCSRS